MRSLDARREGRGAPGRRVPRPGAAVTDRRGFGLLELLLAVTVGALLLALAGQLSTRTLEAERGMGERAGLAASLRTGAAYLAHELEALGADSVSGPDLDSTVAGIAFRAQRGLRVTCRVVPDTVVVVADTALDWSSRGPIPGRDSLLLYAPGDSAAVVDVWDPLPLLATRGSTCGAGRPALALVTPIDSSLIARRRHTGRTVVRLFESVAVRAYGGAGGWQLGVQSLSGGGVIQPLAGGLAPSGLTVESFARSGAPAPLGPSTWAVGVVLRGRTERQLAAGLAPRSPNVTDSVAVVVMLRNRR